MILPAEHDEPSLAAQQKRQPAASGRPTSTSKNRVWGFENHPSGRSCSSPDLSRENATRSVQFSYEIASGRIEHYQYDPFGNVIASTGSLQQNYRWSSKETDVSAGLVYYLYRIYDPSTCRWTNRDPIDENGGLNLYEITQNSTPNAVDVFGYSTLSYKDDQKLKKGLHGFYSWVIKWVVSKSDSLNGGEILQNVDLEFDVHNCDDKSVIDQSPIKYNETWQVIPDTDVVDGTFYQSAPYVNGDRTEEVGEDTDVGKDWGKCTYGSIHATYKARYYPNQAIPKTWKRGDQMSQPPGNPSPEKKGYPSGLLLTTLDNPNWSTTNASDLLTRHVDISWDCDCDSTPPPPTPPASQPGPQPPLAPPPDPH